MSLLADSVLVVAAVGAGAIAYRAWRNRPKAGTTALAGMMLGIFLWSVAHLVEHHTTGAVDLGAEKLKWVGIIPVAFLWFAFVLDYTGREKFLTRRNLILLLGWPVLLMLWLWVPESSSSALSIWPQLDDEQGLVFWGHIGLSYGLLGVGSGLLLQHIWSLPSLFRRQRLVVLTGLIVGWAGSVVSVFELFGDIHFHALPSGFALMGGFLLWAIFGGGLTKITPIARHTVMETLAAGIVVIDAEQRVMSVNPTAKHLLRLNAETSVIGQSVSEVLADFPTLRDRVNTLGSPTNDRREIIHIDERVIEFELSPLSDDRDRFVGGALLLYDITKQRHQQAKLERQNERLEKFASIVSHDLRNPLNVASGRVALAQKDCESPHLEAAERAHTRMEELIDNLLTLAKQSEQAVDTTTVSVPTLVDQCWQNVVTEGAELGQVADITIKADPQRLRQLLENLFKNAVEHGGSDVTISVGECEDGFYVADDGEGIDAHDRQNVFEAGYSTTKAGTGFGLNIVSEIAAAHGWDVHVTSSASGGARFEFTNVAPR